MNHYSDSKPGTCRHLLWVGSKCFNEHPLTSHTWGSSSVKLVAEASQLTNPPLLHTDLANAAPDNIQRGRGSSLEFFNNSYWKPCNPPCPCFFLKNHRLSYSKILNLNSASSPTPVAVDEEGLLSSTHSQCRSSHPSLLLPAMCSYCLVLSAHFSFTEILLRVSFAQRCPHSESSWLFHKPEGRDLLCEIWSERLAICKTPLLLLSFTHTHTYTHTHTHTHTHT